MVWCSSEAGVIICVCEMLEAVHCGTHQRRLSSFVSVRCRRQCGVVHIRGGSPNLHPPGCRRQCAVVLIRGWCHHLCLWDAVGSVVWCSSEAAVIICSCEMQEAVCCGAHQRLVSSSLSIRCRSQDVVVLIRGW